MTHGIGVGAPVMTGAQWLAWMTCPRALGKDESVRRKAVPPMEKVAGPRSFGWHIQGWWWWWCVCVCVRVCVCCQ